MKGFYRLIATSLTVLLCGSISFAEVSHTVFSGALSTGSSFSQQGLTYSQFENGNLVFGFFDGASWQVENIDTGLLASDTKLLPGSIPRVLFFNSKLSAVVLATKTGSVWNQEIIAAASAIDGEISYSTCGVDILSLIHI